jgi:hypothetical protein
VLAALRDHRCKASEETIRQALVGNDREEHVFALAQALELYDTYQAKVADCDVRIEAVLERLQAECPVPAAPLPAPRCQDAIRQRARLPGTRGLAPDPGRGPDPDPRPRAVSRAQAGGRVRHQPLGLAQRQALHLVAVSRAQQQDLRRQGALGQDPALDNRAAALLRLAAVAVGRTETALGAFYRRLSGRVGKAKAVTATARKIAVLFSNTLRHGMAYADPGASYYEERYKQRVLANLQRRAKSLGYVLQAADPAPAAARVS